MKLSLKKGWIMMKKVIEAMKTIRDYCKSLPVDGCCKCLFKLYCFGMNPEDWDVEEATRLKETKSI